MTARDDFTTTADGAAAFERWHDDPFYEPLDNTPDATDLAAVGEDLRRTMRDVRWGDPSMEETP